MKKAALSHDENSDRRLDTAAVSETWMLSDDPGTVEQDIHAPDRYFVLHTCRGSPADMHRGGGVAIIYCDSFNVSTGPSI